MRLVSTNEKNPEFHPQLANPESPERGNAYSPLKGHAIAHSGTVIGLLAIVLWGFMAGLVRLVSESFGATLGSALIYTVGGILLLVVRKPTPIRRAPRKYLIICGIMFVAYEASISLSIGLASTAAQSVEVSLVNYLWPTLLVLMTAAVSHKRGAVWKALPGAIVATIGVAMAVGGESLNVHEALRNISSNPLPYALAFAGAFIWAIYATVTPKMSDGYDGTTIFFCCVAVVLWLIHFTSGKACLRLRPGLVVMLRWLLVPHLLREDMPVGDMACCTEAWRRWRLGRMRRRCSPRLLARFCWAWRSERRSGLAWRLWWAARLSTCGSANPPPVCPFLVNRTSEV